MTDLSNYSSICSSYHCKGRPKWRDDEGTWCEDHKPEGDIKRMSNWFDGKCYCHVDGCWKGNAGMKVLCGEHLYQWKAIQLLLQKGT